MKVTVCQLPDAQDAFLIQWQKLCEHTAEQKSELVLLPEMPFSSWVSAERQADPDRWLSTVQEHEAWLLRLAELAPAIVFSTRPILEEGQPFNEGFGWDLQHGILPVHRKYYLPEDEDFWESSWYRRGDGSFEPVSWGSVRIGFMICSELWFFERARAYGKQGVQILLTPRATARYSVDKWLTGGRAAAVVSGAYSLSSNKVSPPGTRPQFGGQGWIVDPDGVVLGLTTDEQPFLTVDLDITAADAAKSTYPRYIQE